MGKRFQFRLETVRRVRARARDEQRRVVAEAASAVTRVEARITGLNDQLRASLVEARGDRRSDRLDVPALRGLMFHQGLLLRRILEARAELPREQQRLARERERLGEVSARLKAIETLRERRWQKHCMALAREEQFQTDDFNGVAYLRARASNEDRAA